MIISSCIIISEAVHEEMRGREEGRGRDEAVNPASNSGIFCILTCMPHSNTLILTSQDTN
jgi:hypothetical protein